VLGGGVSAAADLLLGPIQEELRVRVRSSSVEEVEFVRAELGTWAGAIGAAIHGAEAAEQAGAAGPDRAKWRAGAPDSTHDGASVGAR
jgi:predicted NBD/HSP70 family sugar kinase